VGVVGFLVTQCKPAQREKPFCRVKYCWDGATVGLVRLQGHSFATVCTIRVLECALDLLRSKEAGDLKDQNTVFATGKSILNRSAKTNIGALMF
jgi:hypothetical protein